MAVLIFRRAGQALVTFSTNMCKWLIPLFGQIGLQCPPAPSYVLWKLSNYLETNRLFPKPDLTRGRMLMRWTLSQLTGGVFGGRHSAQLGCSLEKKLWSLICRVLKARVLLFLFHLHLVIKLPSSLLKQHFITHFNGNDGFKKQIEESFIS